MSLDDRAADGEPDAHAVALRRVERHRTACPCSERSRPTPASRTVTRTRSPASRSVLISNCRGRSCDSHHRVRGVAEQVQDDLLELDAIAGDDREIIGELRLKNDAISLKVAQRQRDDLSRGVVQIERLQRELPLAEQRTQARDHVRRAVAIANRAPRGFARAVDVRRIGGQHPQTGAGVGDDARERLIDLMSDRGGQGAHGRDSRHMRELGAEPCSAPPRRPCSRSRPEGRRRTSGDPSICSMTWATPRTCFTAPRDGHDAEGET